MITLSSSLSSINANTNTETISPKMSSATTAATSRTNHPVKQNETFAIHYFATASQYTGKHSERLPAPLPLIELFDVLEAKYPGIKEKVLKSCSVSVGDEYVDIPLDPVDQGSHGNHNHNNNKEEDGRTEERDIKKPMMRIEAGFDVAIIPPVSSG